MTSVIQVPIDRLVEWYIGERKLLIKGEMHHENAAFKHAANWALGGLNETFKSRLNLLIGHLSEADQVRIGDYCVERMKQNVEDWDFPVKKSQPGDMTLKHYLKVMEDSLTASRSLENKLNLRSLSKDDSPEKRQEAVRMIRVLWGHLRNARVFDFEPDVFVTAYTEADRYTNEKIAGYKYGPQDGTDPFKTQAEADEYVRKIRDAGLHVQFPEKLPFDSTYIGFGFGVTLSKTQLNSRMVAGPARDRVIGAAILGILISGADGGRVTELLQVVEPEDNYTLPVMTCEHGIWIDPEWSLHPWIITHLVAIIAEHQKLTVLKAPGLGYKKDLQKLGKRVGVPDMIPRPYYLLRMTKDMVIETSKRENKRLSAIQRMLSYRHDRMGHERCYIQRGPLPMDEKLATKLAEAEYRIWTLEQPDAVACTQLMKRGQPPKQTEEWLAILTRWIDDQVVGDEKLPYVPAIRLPAANG